MSKIATLLSSASANVKKTAVIQARIEEKLDLVADLVATQHAALVDICNAFETEGCEDCGTVDTETINKARKLLGWKMLNSSGEEIG